jgi:hypothetical protein
MIIDRSQRAWVLTVAAIALAATALYLVYAASMPNGPNGRSVPGLIFGFAGTALILLEALLSLRKKLPAYPLGRLRVWLSAHVWLGLLSFLLILCHSGWHWGHGIAGLLMWLFLIITLSGMGGMVLQHYLPRRMTELVPRETVYEQIPQVIRHLREDADERVQYVTADLKLRGKDDDGEERTWMGAFRAGGIKFYFDPEQRRNAQQRIDAEIARRKAAPQIPVDEQFTEALRLQYLKEIRPFLMRRPSLASRGLFRNPAAIAAYFKHLRTFMPLAMHVVLQDLEDIVEERRQLETQAQMHLWLHGWLLVHVPLSAGLLLLIAVHAVTSLRF